MFLTHVHIHTCTHAHMHVLNVRQQNILTRSQKRTHALTRIYLRSHSIDALQHMRAIVVSIRRNTNNELSERSDDSSTESDLK